MAGSYRRPSLLAVGPRPALLTGQTRGENLFLSREEREQITRDERNLLRDNNLIPPKQPRTASEDGIGARLSKTLSFGGLRRTTSAPDEEARDSAEPQVGSSEEPTETTALLRNGEEAAPYTPSIDKKWEEAVLAGLIHTTWQREAKVLARYASPLIVTFILQYSLTVASVFTVGHIGKMELGAVSLASSKSSPPPALTSEEKL
jgi:MATE family multidrug resistance protein